MPRYIYEVKREDTIKRNVIRERSLYGRYDYKRAMPRSRTYVMKTNDAIQAAARAEAQAELHRSGELRRRELVAESRALQAELRRFSQRLYDIREDARFLEPSLQPLPESSDALERWVSEMKVLRDVMKVAVPELASAYRKRYEEECRQREAWQRKCDEEDEREFVEELLEREPKPHDHFDTDRRLFPRFLTRAEKVKLSNLQRGRSHMKGIRCGLDPDRRRMWRKARRLIAA